MTFYRVTLMRKWKWLDLNLTCVKRVHSAVSSKLVPIPSSTCYYIYIYACLSWETLIISGSGGLAWNWKDQMGISRRAFNAIFLVVFLGWLMIWIMLPTNTYKLKWVPDMTLKLNSTYFQAQGLVWFMQLVFLINLWMLKKLSKWFQEQICYFSHFPSCSLLHWAVSISIFSPPLRIPSPEGIKKSCTTSWNSFIRLMKSIDKFGQFS